MKNAFLIFLFTSNLFSQWQKVSNDSSISGTSWTLISNQNKLFAAGYNLYFSTDEGKTWKDVIVPGYFNGYVNTIISDSNRLYVGTGAGFHFSTDNGSNWFRSGIFTENIRHLAAINNSVFASTFASSTIYRSTDFGVHWSPIPPLPNINSSGISSLYSAFGKVFVGTYGAGIYISSDSGSTWKQITGDGISGLVSINDFIAVKGKLFALANRALISTDQGDSWQELPKSPSSSNSCDAKNNAIFTTTFDGASETIDDGNTWKTINEGFPEERICTGIVVSDKYLISGMQLNGIWRRPLSELTNVKTNVDPYNINVSLSQNYPNPFNSETKIDYPLAKASFVVVEIFDVIGRKVHTITSANKGIGTYSVSFDALNFPSGIYFYKLTTNQGIALKKMILLK